MSALAVHLQALYQREITRLVIGLSPGHAKSTIVSHMFPVWCWINDPFSRWLCASHSLDLSLRDNVYRRRLIESEWFQQNYGHIFELAHDQNVKSFFQNDKQGYMMALAVRGSGTGKRATALLIDDANNAMAGKADQEATVEWHSKTWTSRINDQEKGMQVVVGQRLGEEDLINHLLKQGGWEHLCLPEEYESSRKCVTSIGWTDPRTQEGELLWPERFPRQVLDKLKESLGSMNYAAQYQQAPVDTGGGKFRKKWFRYYDCLYRVDMPGSGAYVPNCYQLQTTNGTKTVFVDECWRFGTVDLAISSKQDADYTVFAVWDVTPDNDLVLVDIVRGHFTNAEQLGQLRSLHFRMKPRFWKIEAIAYQAAFLQQGINAGIPCKEFRPTKDKVARSSPFAVWMENGKVFFPVKASWLVEVEVELLNFPRGRNDDIVDVCSMAGDEICIPTGPVMWSIDDEPTPRSDNMPQPLQGERVRVASVFDDDDFDEGVTFDVEVGRW